MKKILALLGVIMLSCADTSAQKTANLFDINGVEMAIAVDMKSDKTFKELYVFQYEGLDLKGLSKYESITFLSGNDNTVKVKADNDILTFTLDEKYRNSNEIVYKGYGLSHRKANYTLNLVANPKTVQDIVFLNGKAVSAASGSDCDSGGEGSSECSTDAGTLGFGSTCSVKCNKGYYACCDDAKNECRCKVEKKKPAILNNNGSN